MASRGTSRLGQPKRKCKLTVIVRLSALPSNVNCGDPVCPMENPPFMESRVHALFQYGIQGPRLREGAWGRSFHYPSLRLLPPAQCSHHPIFPPSTLHPGPLNPWILVSRDGTTTCTATVDGIVCHSMISHALMQHLDKQPRSSSNQSGLDASRHVSAMILCPIQTAVIRPAHVTTL